MNDTGEKQVQMNLKATDIPRTIALHEGDERAVADYVGRMVAWLNGLLHMGGIDPSSIPEDRYVTMLAAVCESNAETVFSTIAALETGSGPELLKRFKETQGATDETAQV